MEPGQPLPLGEERAVGARGHLAEVCHWCSSAAKNPQAAGKARIAVSNFFDSGSPSKNVKKLGFCMIQFFIYRYEKNIFYLLPNSRNCFAAVWL